MPFDKTTTQSLPGSTPKRSPVPYIVALVIFLAGLGGFAGLLFIRLGGMEEKLVQIVVPGGQDVELKEPGDYTIFHEYHSVVGNEVFATAEDIGGLKAKVTSTQTGAEIQLKPASSATYDFGGRSGRSVFEFSVSTPGLYRVEAGYPESAEGPRTVLTVSLGFLKDLFITIFSGLGILFGSVALSAGIAIVTFLKRRPRKTIN